MNAYTQSSLSVRIMSFFCTLFLFLSLLLVLMFAVYIAAPAATETTPVRYVLRIDGIDRDTAVGITANTPVTDAVTKASLGVITEVKPVPYRVETVENGDVSLFEDTRRISLLLTVDADADKESLAVGGVPLLIGKTVYLRLPTYTGASVCIQNTEVLYETTQE